jgi:uncharacterized protein
MNITPLKSITKDQIKKLNDFLLSLDSENNAMNVNEAQGLFTAILSAPSLIMPSMYNAIIFGGNPVFESEEQSAMILSFIMGLRNNIANELNKKIFNLMLWENEKLIPYQEATLAAISEWCKGYCIGAQIDPVWSENQEANVFLLPFNVLSDQIYFSDDEDYSQETIVSSDQDKEQYRSHLPIFVKDFYKYWEDQRKISSPIYGKDELLFWLEPKTAPDTICPCGSNKKFIDCCKTKKFH